MSAPRLEVSVEYLQREKARGHDVEKWVRGYAKRNRIPVTREMRQRTWEEVPELVLLFRSEHQFAHFLSRARRACPYFEFL